MSIQNSVNSAIGTLAGAAIAGKHLTNQKEANLNQAALNVKSAEHDVKLSELEQNAVETEYGKAAENTVSLNEQVNAKTKEVDAMSREIAGLNKNADMAKNIKNSELDLAMRPDRSARYQQEHEKYAAQAEKSEKSFREQAANRGHDKDIAQSALENLEKDRTAALDMEQRIYDRLEVLRENTRYSRERLDYAKDKYKKLGGK